MKVIKDVIDIISNYTKVSKEEIHADSGLISDLGLNSLDIVNAIVDFEEAFEIEIEDRNVMTFRTIEDVVKYINSKKQDNDYYTTIEIQ